MMGLVAGTSVMLARSVAPAAIGRSVRHCCVNPSLVGVGASQVRPGSVAMAVSVPATTVRVMSAGAAFGLLLVTPSTAGKPPERGTVNDTGTADDAARSVRTFGTGITGSEGAEKAVPRV